MQKILLSGTRDLLLSSNPFSRMETDFLQFNYLYLQGKTKVSPPRDGADEK